MPRATWPTEPATRTPDPDVDAPILDAATGRPLIVWIGGNLLQREPPDLPGGPGLLAAWSGHPSPDPAAFFDRDPRAWLGPAAAAFDAACDAMAPRLEAGGQRLLLRPHARHILGDPHRCAAFLDARVGRPFGVLLDAASMVEAGMPGPAEFVARSFEVLAPRAAAALLPDDPELAAAAAPCLQRLPPDAVVIGPPAE